MTNTERYERLAYIGDMCEGRSVEYLVADLRGIMLTYSSHKDFVIMSYTNPHSRHNEYWVYGIRKESTDE